MVFQDAFNSVARSVRIENADFMVFFASKAELFHNALFFRISKALFDDVGIEIALIIVLDLGLIKSNMMFIVEDSRNDSPLTVVLLAQLS